MAIAPTKCGMVREEHKPTFANKQVSVFQVIGDKDKSYHGSEGPIQMYSAKERIDLWVKAKSCDRNPRVIKDPGKSRDLLYSCPGRSPVRILILDGVGHRLGKYWTEVTDRMIIDYFRSF